MRCPMSAIGTFSRPPNSSPITCVRAGPLSWHRIQVVDFFAHVIRGAAVAFADRVLAHPAAFPWRSELAKMGIGEDALLKFGRHETMPMNACTKTQQMLPLVQQTRAQSEVEDVIVEAVPASQGRVCVRLWPAVVRTEA